jgi:hypothetical protein
VGTLNQFTGASDRTLRIRLANLNGDFEAARSGDGHCGSPGEGILEQIHAIEAELAERKLRKAEQSR